MKLKILGVLVLLQACVNNEGVESPNKFSSVSSRQVPVDSLLNYAYRTKKLASSLHSTEFPKEWIKLSKNAMGYFIYHVKNTNKYNLVRGLRITPDSLSHYGIGEEINWLIREQKEIEKGKYYYGLGEDTLTSTYARCTLEVVNEDIMFAILSTAVYRMNQFEEELLGSFSGVYIPRSNQHLFYHIDEPNLNSPDSWIPLDEIKLGDFRKKSSR